LGTASGVRADGRDNGMNPRANSAGLIENLSLITALRVR
jgi:hypothetical protein